jgi:hypothetical protein
MNMFSDPLKLLPFIGYVGIFALLGLNKITFDQAVVMFGLCGAGHAAISSVNNVNPK